MTLLVARLNDAFATVWEDLARRHSVELAAFDDGIADEPVAVIVAAAGVEQRAVDWLRSSEGRRDVPVLVVGTDPQRRIAVQTIQAGATDYLVLPEDIEILNNSVADAIRARDERRRRVESVRERERAGVFAGIIGKSKALRQVISRAKRVLRHGSPTVLILGETGTGKELFARALHDGSQRASGPFVPVNCSALPEQLIESELFGHERGAFTDARESRPGLFELAHKGTLFLDEVGTLPLTLQAKLLRVLDDGHVRRVGGSEFRRVDTRILTATNVDLHDQAQSGKFRRDLYYRLNVIMLELPPLRDRDDDAILIAQDLIYQLASHHQLPEPPLTPAIKSRLLGYRWPGNVRELKNAVERAMWLSPPGSLLPEELVPDGPRPEAEGPIPFPATLDEIAAAAARAALSRCGNNRSEAARRLGISRRRLARLVDPVHSHEKEKSNV